MKCNMQPSSNRRPHIVIFTSAAFFLVSASPLDAVPVTVFGVGYQLGAGLPTELYRFHEDGAMEQEWNLADSRQSTTLTTDGASLYVGEFSGAIERYDFQGNYLGQFADVGSLAGTMPTATLLEVDAAGSLYAAFGGFRSAPRTSFRLNQNGAVTATFSHVDLVFPSGIDSTASGDVYIVNSAGVGVGVRLFKFNAAGTYLGDFALPNAQNPADIAINEVTGELYVADEFDDSILVYDVLASVPIFKARLEAPGAATDIFVEPSSGRIFGSYSTLETDAMGIYLKNTGFEISRDGDVLNLYVVDAPAREQRVRSLVAIKVPEPPRALVIMLIAGCYLAGRQSKFALPRRRRGREDDGDAAR